MAEESVSDVISELVAGVTTATIRMEAMSEIVTNLSVRLDEIAAHSHQHRWDILGVAARTGPEMYRPVHPRLSPQSAVTQVLVRCADCNLPATAELDGTWTMEQITRKATGDE